MIIRPSWRMREEGEMLAFVAECPDCRSPASGVISSHLLRSPVRDLPEVFCTTCRKRFRTRENDLLTFAVSAHRCG